MQSIDLHTTHVELIRSETKRVKEFVSGLPSEAMELPTPCPLWNVGEVIAHLTWTVETYGGMMERGLHGDQSPIGDSPLFLLEHPIDRS